MSGKFETYQDGRGEHRFRLKAGNGQNVLASEGYKTKTSCMNGVESVKKNSQDANRQARHEVFAGLSDHREVSMGFHSQGSCLVLDHDDLRAVLVRWSGVYAHGQCGVQGPVKVSRAVGWTIAGCLEHWYRDRSVLRPHSLECDTINFDGLTDVEGVQVVEMDPGG